MKRVSLLQMKKNQKAKVMEISGGTALRHRLLSMGVYPGREVTKLNHIALRGPITIKAGRSTFALGHTMAAKVILETE